MALIASRGAIDVEPLIRFGFFLGAAFQIRDDVLNLIGDAARYGKEINGDLYEGKRSLMIIHLLAETTAAERRRLVRFLGKEREGAVRSRSELAASPHGEPRIDRKRVGYRGGTREIRPRGIRTVLCRFACFARSRLSGRDADVGART